MKLPKIETLVILLFLGSVLLWGISRCNSKRAQLTAKDKSEEEDDRPANKPKRDTVFVQPQATQPVVNQPQTSQQIQQQPFSQAPARTPQSTPQAVPQNPGAVVSAPAGTTAKAAPPAATTQRFPTVYVTIDGLKMRKEPGLKGDMVTKLELYQPVFFLNQKTEWTQEISLGTEKVTDHWVKIRTASGKEGWVFGAGVHYYKMKRKGTLE